MTAPRGIWMDDKPATEPLTAGYIRSALSEVLQAISSCGQHSKQRRQLLGQARDFLQAALRTFDK